jgi:hypothetical protein
MKNYGASPLSAPNGAPHRFVPSGSRAPAGGSITVFSSRGRSRHREHGSSTCAGFILSHGSNSGIRRIGTHKRATRNQLRTSFAHDLGSEERTVAKCC